MDNEKELLLRKIAREQAARKHAEKILEEKAAELYQRTQQLHKANQQLEGLLNEKNSQLQGIFENIVDAYVVMDLTGNVLRMNEAASQLFGVNLEEEPLNVTSLIYTEDLAYAMESFNSLTQKGFFTNYQARVITRKKGVRWVQINASLVFNEKNQPIAAQGIVRDITDQLNKANALAFISEVSQEILGKVRFEDIGTILAEKVSSYLKTDDCIVYLLKDEKGYLEQISATGAKIDADGNIVAPIQIPLGKGIVGSVAESGNAEIIANTTKDSRYIVDDQLRLSEITVPIIIDGLVLGVIDAEHPKANYFTKSQLKTVEAVSNLVALQLRSAKDVSARKESEARNVKLLGQLERSNQELSEYAHMVSHDLKSPLRSISALVAWIKEDNQEILTGESKAHFSLLEDTVVKMEDLISRVLDYAAIERTGETKEAVDLNTLILNIKELIYFPDHIELQIPEPLPTIMADPVRMQQLFQNLIVNAIKYNDKEKGFVTIKGADAGDHYEFSVEDNGMGIAKEYHDKIFKIFQSLSTDKESTGIGLALVKKIVRSVQGEIWLESQEGLGTTFFFTLKKQ